MYTLGRTQNIISFIYCDYATGEEDFRQEQNTFRGYYILGSRSVKHSELIPNGWTPKFLPRFNLEAYQKYKDNWKPFITWTVYERDVNRDNMHGPKRFSLLYLGGEGVASYQALYWTNQMKPKALAIIQPGTGFGLNWTDFRDENRDLGWVVRNNPSGEPDIIYYGGYGSGYNDFAWNGYSETRIIHHYYNYNNGEVRVFTRQNPE